MRIGAVLSLLAVLVFSCPPARAIALEDLPPGLGLDWGLAVPESDLKTIGAMGPYVNLSYALPFKNPSSEYSSFGLGALGELGLSDFLSEGENQGVVNTKVVIWTLGALGKVDLAPDAAYRPFLLLGPSLNLAHTDAVAGAFTDTTTKIGFEVGAGAAKTISPLWELGLDARYRYYGSSKGVSFSAFTLGLSARFQSSSGRQAAAPEPEAPRTEAKKEFRAKRKPRQKKGFLRKLRKPEPDNFGDSDAQ